MPYIVFKRILDLIFSLILLIVALPIMVIAAIVISLESKGSPLFKQERPGKNGVIFTVFKFRTMKIETVKDGKLLTDMERMTKIGSLLRKTSVDELPQLFNILRGEMSFIGPRPLLVKYLEYYSDEQMRRHEVTPGISGWAQVNGRNTISWEEKFKSDLWYVDNISLSLDLKILWLTIYNVLNRKDINNSQGDTMPYFTGNTKKSKV
ncbi:sugar transferase [Peribacillus simplex]|uniref:sugar transferase n=1 Tax=Peribacillus simplex TaxID=1478 RepID=UPI000BA7AB34|nr:sugar transferase [Peribacillus simplex]PAL14213.1 lipid carrier--UDP-N-acetylgalactosaminyltransferase [Peribacillus simplex]